MLLKRYSIGMGDRFGREAESQLAAVIEAGRLGIEVTPVWNKSNREHSLIGSRPEDVRQAAAKAVAESGWKDSWFTDADHISRKTYSSFVSSCDFFTLDVAEQIGKPVSGEDLSVCRASLEGISGVSQDTAVAAAARYLPAVREAGLLFRAIREAKGGGDFIVEVSMDETDKPQTPEEFLCILKMIADEGIPADTVAPRFCGRFNKGIDFRGDLAAFDAGFDALVAALVRGKKEFGLKPELKLSVHSGSDKWSLYPLIAKSIRKYTEGLHLKTAGTTWLEELAGLAESGPEGLSLCRKITLLSLPRFAELCAPYRDVVEIDPVKLPGAEEAAVWSAEEFCRSLRNDPADEKFNPDFRQFLHVSFPVAAALGSVFTDLLTEHHSLIGSRVRDNLLRRHILPLYSDSRS